MAVLFPSEEFALLKDQQVLYRCALKNMEMRVDVLLEDFSHLQTYNPIEHIKSRLKSPESIADKLARLGHPLTAQSARKHLTDVAGLRCICSYARDIFHIVDTIKRQPDITVLSEKNYVTNPKPTGYRSYHLIIEVPVFLSDRTELLPVEVQLRTQAMDFWASLEHKVRYKYTGGMPEHLAHDLRECAEKIAELDNRMYLIQDLVDMAY